MKDALEVQREVMDRALDIIINGADSVAKAAEEIIECDLCCGCCKPEGEPTCLEDDELFIRYADMDSNGLFDEIVMGTDDGVHVGAVAHMFSMLFTKVAGLEEKVAFLESEVEGL